MTLRLLANYLLVEIAVLGISAFFAFIDHVQMHSLRITLDSLGLHCHSLSSGAIGSLFTLRQDISVVIGKRIVLQFLV